MATVGNGYQTGSADPGFYQNALKNLISNPGSFSGTPGYQFALNQGLDAVQRSNSAIRGSGNALIALQDRGNGLASQNYMDYLKTLGGLGGQEQSYDLGLAGANNTAQGNANQYALGQQQNANTLALGTQANTNTANRNANDYALGQGQLGLGYTQAGNQYDLGKGQIASQYSLGSQQNANQAQNNWYNYSLGASRNQNDYNLGQGELGLGYYNADTNRGSAQSNAYLGDQANQRAWYGVFPRQRVAGQP